MQRNIEEAAIVRLAIFIITRHVVSWQLGIGGTLSGDNILYWLKMAVGTLLISPSSEDFVVMSMANLIFSTMD